MSTVSAPAIKSSASRLRITSTWILALCIGAVLLSCESVWSNQAVPDILLEIVGLLLVGASAFGRIWTSMYISGRKTYELVTHGPYSIVRNPLYVFNLIGAVGLGLSTESLLLCAALLLAFAAYYPSVIVNEERILSNIHGDEYAKYCARVPRSLPSLAAYHEPKTCTVDMRIYRRSFLDATVFLWVYAGLQMVEKMHQLKLLPNLFKIV